MQLHELKPTQKKATAKRTGRGGKRGKTSGRGHKGQLARAGNSTRPEMRDLIKKLPKLRGHGVNRARTVHTEKRQPIVVNLAQLADAFSKGDTVSPQSLATKKILKMHGKKVPLVKILGNGDISIALKVTGCLVSNTAKEKIEQAGGTIA